MTRAVLNPSEIEELRSTHYNSTVVDMVFPHDDLMIVRVQLDEGRLRYEAGQYTVLGLGYWEPRIADTQPEDIDEARLRTVIKRAYSISCGLLDAQGEIVTATDDPVLEFYITLVRQAVKPPALTPRLFGLSAGDRLLTGTHAHGHYSLGQIEPDDNIVFAATGTGEAPHNAMLAELLRRGHRGRIVSVACVRYRHDLGYLDKHHELERRWPNYCYLPLTTREPENVDPQVAGFVGKRYLQKYFESGELEDNWGIELDPDRTHVFLCGSPEMIGVPRRSHDPAQRYPEPMGMVEVLEKRGFHVDQPHHVGNIHFEKYW